METLTIKVKNKERLMFLYEMLRYYDFLELPELSELQETEQKKTEHNFFQSAGMWKDRDILHKKL
ncbi:MAG: hypothetical protein U9N85_06000 [Bacteroidota bacterium]|nr:hypothetical protein [Bacteroidota bacterium]